MKQGLQTVKSWLDAITGVLTGLLIVSLLIGILYPGGLGESFDPLKNLADWLNSVEKGGLAGLLAVMLVYVWYKKG